MPSDPLTGASELIRLIAERRGLARAFALVPALWRPAVERAAQPLPPPPTGAITEPARGLASDPRRGRT